MKHLQLELNKRLLIVEIEMAEFVASMLIGDFFPNYEMEFICKGPDLTEEVAFNLVERTIEIKTGKTKFYNYKDVIQLPYYNTALEAFISAIESKNYHWGENPLRKPEHTIEWYDNSQTEFERYENDMQEWQESESRTFNPEKCIIFEIL